MQTKLSDGSVIVCGFVPKDAETKQVGEKQCTLTTFGIKVGERQNGSNKEAVWANCQAWHDLGHYAAQIRKGDVVFAVGKLDVREYEGKTYKNVNCEYISIQGKADRAAPQPPTFDTADLPVDATVFDDDGVPF